MLALDQRVMRIGIEIRDKITYFENLNMYAVGVKYANALQNECEVKISNLDKNTENYILTETSPYNSSRTPKSIIVEAGRKSMGLSRIYKGNIVTSSITQPPDTTITLKCLTGNFEKGNIISKTQPGIVTLQQVSKQLANDLDLLLDFQATNKNISNHYYAGASIKEINNIQLLGGINIFIDDDRLVVKDSGVPLVNVIRELNSSNGLVGIPEQTERGMRAKFLIDSLTRLGSTLRLTSTMNPSLNSDYVIYQLGFEIANREEPFYYIAEAARRPT